MAVPSDIDERVVSRPRVSRVRSDEPVSARTAAVAITGLSVALWVVIVDAGIHALAAL